MNSKTALKGLKRVTRSLKRKPKKAGLAPGSLIYTGEKKTEQINITLIDYNEDKITEKTFSKIEDVFEYKDSSSISWINIDGLHDIDVIEKLGNYFGIHPLVQEDILNVQQRPKMEEYDDYLYIVFKMFTYKEERSEVYSEQISLILNNNYIITFQERTGDVFDPIRERLRAAKGKIRKSGTDYLAYTLIDAVVDSYFFVLEKFGEEIEILEDELILSPKPESSQLIHRLRRELIMLRKSVWPMRELLSGLYRGDSSLIKKSSQIYLRDVYDHTIQVIDTIESYRDMVSGMLDTYLSSISNRMNEVMKVLTIIATIFIPLTFIAGVYGMNFHHMPELEWTWIYPAGFWIAILIIAGIMLLYFRRKKWL